MGRPAARELTERELEVMHAFWGRAGDSAVAEVRDDLARSGLDRAYTTIATLVRILVDKGFLIQTTTERPYKYHPARTRDEVTGQLLDEVIERVFRGSREKLLVKLMEQEELTPGERAILEGVLRESKP